MLALPSKYLVRRSIKPLFIITVFCLCVQQPLCAHTRQSCCTRFTDWCASWLIPEHYQDQWTIIIEPPTDVKYPEPTHQSTELPTPEACITIAHDDEATLDPILRYIENRTVGRHDAFIFDIDGTAIINTHNHYGVKSPVVFSLYSTLIRYGYKIIFLTSRPDLTKKITPWLEDYADYDDEDDDFVDNTAGTREELCGAGYDKFEFIIHMQRGLWDFGLGHSNGVKYAVHGPWKAQRRQKIVDGFYGAAYSIIGTLDDLPECLEGGNTGLRIHVVSHVASKEKQA